MNQKHNIKKQKYEKREEEKAQNVFKWICISLLLIGVLLVVLYGFVL